MHAADRDQRVDATRPPSARRGRALPGSVDEKSAAGDEEARREIRRTGRRGRVLASDAAAGDGRANFLTHDDICGMMHIRRQRMDSGPTWLGVAAGACPERPSACSGGRVGRRDARSFRDAQVRAAHPPAAGPGVAGFDTCVEFLHPESRAIAATGKPIREISTSIQRDRGLQPR